MADNKDTIKELRELNLLLEQQKTIALALNNIEQARASQAEILANNEKIIAELRGKGKDLTKEEEKYLKEIENRQKGINTQLEKEVNNRKKLVDRVKEVNHQISLGLRYLMDSDKIIKSTILNLGMSGAKAALMRDSFEQSAGYVASLGGSLEDVGTIMTGYADETGRARVLSAEMVRDITAIGKGTGLGIEQATRLGAQFELMGFDARSTMEYVQGVVDTTERMGVNTTKVLKNVNDNFKRLNTYTFQQGVKGFAQMASYAEKFRVDITQALNAADVARSLEGAIDLAANLQIMGGEFAKTDPFEMLFLSRNDPAKFTEKITEMTKGVVTFRKMADGSFEKFISPADRDRLAAVAKSLGMEASALTEMAERQAEIQRMRQQMAGMGLGDKEKELIEGAAIFNKETGRFEVKLAGKMQDVANLTKAQAESFAKETVSLEKRAKEAMTFEETLKATLNELKATLLPILNTINKTLTWTRTNILEPLTNFSKSIGAWGTGAGLIAAAVIWKGVVTKFNHGIEKWVTKGAGVGRSVGNAGTASVLPGSPSGLAEQRRGIGAGAASKGAGMKALGTGAGVGAAAAGIGAGVMLAAKGIGELAKSMSALDSTQIWALPATVLALSASFFAFTPAIAAAAGASTAGAVGLLALGVAAVGIGFGINLAAKGIGKMAEGLGSLVSSSKGAGKDMLMVAGGIAGIAGSLALFSNPLSALGIGAFAGVMAAVAIGAGATALVANSIAKMGVSMKGTKDDWIAIQNAVASISKANIRGGGALTELANMLKKPLKVEFNDKNVAVVSNITMQIDGEKIFQKTYRPNARVQRDLEVKNGYASG
jgi:hypothetical protein